MNDLDRLAELERGRDAATQYEMKSAHEDAIRLWWKKHAPALLATARRAAKLEKVAEAARAGIAGMKPDDGDGAFWLGHGACLRIATALAELEAP